jgi:hypothetical protein
VTPITNYRRKTRTSSLSTIHHLGLSVPVKVDEKSPVPSAAYYLIYTPHAGSVVFWNWTRALQSGSAACLVGKAPGLTLEPQTALRNDIDLLK